jgi:hypothetical protein
VRKALSRDFVAYEVSEFCFVFFFFLFPQVDFVEILAIDFSDALGSLETISIVASADYFFIASRLQI